MTEGIEFNDQGTVDVTFDDKTYHLPHPKFGRFKYYTRKLEEQRKLLSDAIIDVVEQAREAEAKYKDTSTPEARAELKRLQDQEREINATPFYERTIEILAEMFEELGDPLPPDPDDWPAWLAANSSIPGKILTHWRNHPKASGSNGAAT